MGGIKIADNVSESVKLLKSVSNTLFVSISSFATFWDINVGGEIWEGIWFDNSYDFNIWILSELSDDFINVLSLVLVESVSACGIFTEEFSVGGMGITVSVWKVINNEHWDLSTFFSSFQDWLDKANVVHGIDPSCSSDVLY